MTEHVTLEDDFLAAALELRATLATIKHLEAQAALLKETIAKALAVGEIGVDSRTGEQLVTVRAGARKFSADLAKQILPSDVVERLQVTTIDAKKAKEILAPALYDAACTQNKASVVAL